ncbi:MAG: hypothetical protein U9N50_01000, partial [Pseudomonadota bacterium]|nr:hypothetical protein [Pseudomonadota bacterium]
LPDVLVCPCRALRQPALGYANQALHGRPHIQEQCDAGCVPQVEQNASANLVYRATGEFSAAYPEQRLSQRTTDGVRVTAARGKCGC